MFCSGEQPVVNGYSEDLGTRPCQLCDKQSDSFFFFAVQADQQEFSSAPVSVDDMSWVSFDDDCSG